MFKRILLMLTLLAMTSFTTGCFHSQVVYDSEYNASKTTPDYQATYFHIIGLVGIGSDVDLNSVCPGGTGLVENKTIITLSVLTIEKMGVYCK